MAVEDSPPPPPPPPSSTDKIILFSIPNKVPIKLDLEKHNYNSWSSFSLIHLGSLGLKSHVKEDNASTNLEWCQLDDLIKMWILGSLCDSLQEQDARAINVDNELRTIKIGKMTLMDLTHSLPYLLKSFDTSEPLPTFENVPYVAHQSTAYQAQQQFAPGQLNSHGLLGAALALYPSQPTLLLIAFSTTSLQDLTWNMDTDLRGGGLGLLAPLRGAFRNLSTIFNKRLLPSIHVGDGNSIPVTNNGHNIIPSHHRPLHLHNVLDFCDSPYSSFDVIAQAISVQRSLYGLKQAPRAWFQWFAVYATRAGFSLSRCDSSLFIYTQGSQIIDALHKEFDMTDLRALNYFLGISVVRHPTGLFLSQKNSTVGYTDADWAGCPSTCRTTSGYCVFLGDNLLLWYAKRQHTISRSSAKVEYRGVTNVVAETAWIRNLLRELHSPLLTAILVYCDNVSAIYMSANPVQHQRTKHIKIDIHFVRDMVKAGHVRVLHVPSHF
ncbi:ribonuclease H-like domain-containing protein [Tanacetum coccineum]|uniref:Ribonuclease H-like domain-containing protein n=1 Tax=Tanacetum coccineum TaxID=301880 RepID=A0ABQ5J472_9ASTR